MLLDKKLLKIVLNPGLNSTIFRGTRPCPQIAKTNRGWRRFLGSSSKWEINYNSWIINKIAVDNYISRFIGFWPWEIISRPIRRQSPPLRVNIPKKNCTSSRGTQREYTSKPLKHYFNGRYRHIFIPSKFFVCSDFLAESLVIRKL